MEWIINHHSHDNMEVDIGFMSEMVLRATSASRPAISENGTDMRGVHILPTDEMQVSRPQWTAEISMEEAERQLEVNMYPFKEVSINFRVPI